ncbi:ATP-dependent RNA helicase ddx51 [Arachnomyces sp. PD_36]|nr:ATP-dependent RNA helicase ddx51 [Arachnomyces sp. PD_36]
MAASFYTRYVPPQENPSISPAEPVLKQKHQQKRKRDVEDVSSKNKSKKKKKKEKETNASANDPSRSDTSRGQSWGPPDYKRKQDETSQHIPEPETDRNTEKDELAYGGVSARIPEEVSEPVGEVEKTTNIDHEGRGPKESSHRLDDSEMEEGGLRKHAGVFSKFKQSTLRSERQAEAGEEDTTPQGPSTSSAPISHGLEPLPQPAVTSEPLEKPSYSSLPPWLSRPITVPSKSRAKFSDLGIHSKLLSNLAEGGYSEAFAIQSALIPLLLRGPNRHLGDVCISAATGSGKTMAYALPLIANLEPLPVAKLRGLIVVPTRELVRQAREACDLCVSGTGLRIGTAVGSVSLREEEQTLMRSEQVYDSHIRQEEALSAKSWGGFRLQDYISDTNGKSDTLPGHTERVSSNVDILICTPGRLVDHIRSTKGFTLGHLDWLVIDEADRLLNESFQDWVEVIIRALDKGNAPDLLGRADKLLDNMGIPLKRREPQKVILSATMTQDITKLNSLRLRNPKLVTVRDPEAEKSSGGNQGVDIPRDVEQSFILPDTLNEFTVSVGDEADKPLYLLQLLLSHIGIEKRGATARGKTAKQPPPSASSESDASSDESSDSSDSSDADSDSSDTSSSSDASSSGGAETPPRATALIFTKSSESASRLSRLLSLLHPPLENRIGTLTKPSKSSTSRKTLLAFRRGKVSVVVATDRASRGLDLPSLGHVVNYDVPSSLTTYVHRIGRTARAGNAGSAWTLVAHREGRWFSNEIAREGLGSITRSTKMRKANVKLDEATDLKMMYQKALQEVGEEVKVGTGRNGGGS